MNKNLLQRLIYIQYRLSSIFSYQIDPPDSVLLKLINRYDFFGFVINPSDQILNRFV